MNKNVETLSCLSIGIRTVTGWNLYSDLPLSLYSDQDRVVLHHAELIAFFLSSFNLKGLLMTIFHILTQV